MAKDSTFGSLKPLSFSNGSFKLKPGGNKHRHFLRLIMKLKPTLTKNRKKKKTLSSVNNETKTYLNEAYKKEKNYSFLLMTHTR